jgi:hypothetical protein
LRVTVPLPIMRLIDTSRSVPDSAHADAQKRSTPGQPAA